jgi:alanine racemase
VTAERAVALVDLGAVERNCAHLVAQLGDAELCAVVKADGYGHGADGCAAAALRGGASRLAVATAHEAEQVGRRFPHVTLLTMGALTPGELDVALAAGSEVSVWRDGFLGLVADRARAQGRTARIHLKHDSGMGRLGTSDTAELMALVEACEGAPELKLTGFWTHFATADERDSDYLDEQLRRFAPLANEVKAAHPAVTVHAANSAAALREPATHFDMARCGIAIYGLDPFQEDPASHELEPALELRSYVADVKRFSAGASAGYGRSWQAPEDTWVGVLPIGYGDGVRRAFSNNAEVLVGGRRRPLVGTVSMDNITIDLGPETDVEPGAEAVLIGTQGDEAIHAEELAQRIGTINYEITCGISQRVPRVPRT